MVSRILLKNAQPVLRYGLRAPAGILGARPGLLQKVIFPSPGFGKSLSSHREIWGEESVNYKHYNEQRSKVLDSFLNGPNRFQRISEREDRSDMPLETLRAHCMGKYFITHRGCQLIKTADDMIIFQQLLWYLRPATIIELGTFTGGSAIWLADMLRLMEIKSRIYSMDIDHSTIEDRVKELKPENVTFLEGDSNMIEKTFTEDFLSELPHPWLVIEDSHTNIYGVLKYFHQFMKPGDYFVVEDLSTDLPRQLGYGRIYPEAKYNRCGSKGLEILKKFLTDYSEHYAVDSFYTDFFGYNGTWNWHGYICRM